MDEKEFTAISSVKGAPMFMISNTHIVFDRTYEDDTGYGEVQGGGTL